MSSHPAAPPKPRTRHRSLRNLADLPRSANLSKFRAAFEQTGQTPSDNWPSLAYFSPSAWWTWFTKYARDAFARSTAFPADQPPLHSVYPLRDERGTQHVRISMAGDWGTGTDEAQIVANGMSAFKPHFTIHLGDVYYVGDLPSINENCLGIPNPHSAYLPVIWPLGSLGSFALNGNHEMYATGEPYFRDFLPHLGLIQKGKPMGQITSYFCLENDYWRIVALDTGYHSRGIPFLNQLGDCVPFLRPSCKLPDPLVQWLRDVLKLQDDDRRGLILLSHHQYVSVFDEEFTRPARQLAEFINRPVLWFWGHEHRFAGYALGGSEKIQAYGRCVGHGGMPVTRENPPPAGGRLLFYDNRLYADDFGWNGYLTLEFREAHLTVKYFDIASILGSGRKDQLLIQEEWDTDGKGGLSFHITQHCLQNDFYGPSRWGR
jgi:hypothetical protein